MTFFLAVLAINVFLFITIVTFVIWRKTHVIEHYIGGFLKKSVKPVLNEDEILSGSTDDLLSVSKLAMGSKVDDHLVIEIGGYAPVQISLENPPRVRDQFRDGSANQIAYNAFDIHRECIKLYDETGDARFVTLFWSFYKQWTSDIRHLCFDDYAWYDHCAAARFVNLRYCTLILLKHGLLCRREHVELLNHTITMGNFVASDKRFDWVTNHGLISDNFLLRGAVTFADEPISRTWISKVVDRSVSRIDYFISNDGVPLEGSTTYWYLIYRLYSDILGVCESTGIDVGPHFRTKLARCAEFLADTNIQGTINRIGDSSGGYEVESVGARSNTKDGYYLRVYDSGLAVFNGIRAGKVISQLMLNAQDQPPYVHRHQDALSIGLYHKGKFWVNSPGSYSADRSNLAEYVKSFRNQSIPYNLQEGYQHNCILSPVKYDESGFILVASVHKSGRLILKREISFDLPNERLSIKDMSVDSTEIRTQFLLNPEVGCDSNDPRKAEMTWGKERLVVHSDHPVIVDEGKISYGRNQLSDTKLLAVESACHTTSFELANRLTSFSVVGSGNAYPYTGRRAGSAGLLNRLVSRFHIRRFRQIFIFVSLELALVAFILWLQ